MGSLTLNAACGILDEDGILSGLIKRDIAQDQGVASGSCDIDVFELPLISEWITACGGYSQNSLRSGFDHLASWLRNDSGRQRLRGSPDGINHGSKQIDGMARRAVAVLVQEQLPLFMTWRICHPIDDGEYRLAGTLESSGQGTIRVIRSIFVASLRNKVVRQRILARLQVDSNLDYWNPVGVSVASFVVVDDSRANLTGGGLTEGSPPREPLKEYDLSLELA